MMPREPAAEMAVEMSQGQWSEAILPGSVALPWSTALPQSATLPLPRERLLSIDFLRGFTMFWIIGGSEVAIAITTYLYPALGDAVETQLYHARWQGFTLLDMVMPMFLFIVGVAMPLSLAKRVETGQPLRPTYCRIFRRVALLWVLGILSQMMKQYVDEDAILLELYSNTLQAIAVGYLVTSIALLHFRIRGQIVLLVSFIAGYGALLMFVPFGGNPAGTLERETNFARYVDVLVLGVFRRDHSFTWITTSLGFSASVLMGAMAGHLLRSQLNTRRRLLSLSVIGVICALCGWLWSYSLPLNRHIWTSSMILWTGGWAFLLLAACHALIDVGRVRRWAFPFVVIGSNALLAYFLQPLFYLATSGFWTEVMPEDFPEHNIYMLACGTEVVLIWLLLWGLFRQRLFFRA
jgi:predicted acyltransferase